MPSSNPLSSISSEGAAGSVALVESIVRRAGCSTACGGPLPPFSTLATVPIRRRRRRPRPRRRGEVICNLLDTRRHAGRYWPLGIGDAEPTGVGLRRGPPFAALPAPDHPAGQASGPCGAVPAPSHPPGPCARGS